MPHRQNAYKGAEQYEQGLFDAQGQAIHDANRVCVAQAVDPLYTEGNAKELTQLRKRLAPVLLALIKEGSLDLSVYRPKAPGQPGGYSKNLLYVSKNPEKPWCLQLFAFEPGQQTAVHSHPCECWCLVAQGRLREVLYVLAAGGQRAIKDNDRVRQTGSVEEFVDGELDDPHRLQNDPLVCTWVVQDEQIHLGLEPNTELAISIHLYVGMDGGGGEARAVSQQRPGGSRNPLTGLGAVKNVYNV